LRGVLSQKLLPRADGTGRVAALEIMDVTPTIVGMLEKGASDDIYAAIRQAGNEAYWGMQTMNQCLLRYFKAGIISEYDALANGNPTTELRQMIRMAVTKGEVKQQQTAPQIPGIPDIPPAPGAPVNR
jgi:Tfp pilus assembly ATPase PilU